MTTSVALDAQEADSADPENLVRVTIREIRETTWRALSAAGASTGEAAIAAHAVTFSEVQLGCGLDAVIQEIERVPAGHVPVSLIAGSTTAMLEDSAHRGLLLLAPLGLGLLAARPTSAPILLPNQPWDCVMSGFLVRHCSSSSGAFFAFEHSEGSFLHGIKAEPDRSITVFRPAELEEIVKRNPGVVESLRDQAPGVLLVSSAGGFHDVNTTPSYSAETLKARRDIALAYGVNVDQDRWMPVLEASHRYLVPDQ